MMRQGWIRDGAVLAEAHVLSFLRRKPGGDGCRPRRSAGERRSRLVAAGLAEAPSVVISRLNLAP